MKITVDIDCSPQEARSFLGLPDVEPMQKALLGDVEARMRAALSAMDPESMFKVWLPAGLQGWEQIQKAFWSQLGSAAPSERKTK